MSAARFYLQTWISTIVLVLAGQSSHAQIQGVLETKVTQIRLEDLGWRPPAPHHYGEMVFPSQQITIDHKGRIVLGFTVRERESLATREQAAFSYHVLRITPDSKVDLSLAVPSNNLGDNGVYLDQDDDLIVRANDLLQVSRESAEGISEHRDWENLLACGPRCRVAQSFSRGTLYVLNSDANPPVAILQGAHPHTVRSCQRNPFDIRLTDVFAYWQEGGAWPSPPPMLDRWPLCDYERETKVEVQSGEFGSVFPLNDQSVVISGYQRIERMEKSKPAIAVISTDGATKFNVQLATHDQPENWVQGSQTGERFAISIATWRGGISWLDISGKRVARRIAVYETSTGKELANFTVTPRALTELTMSPDGHRVAVLANGTVTIAEIP